MNPSFPGNVRDRTDADLVSGWSLVLAAAGAAEEAAAADRVAGFACDADGRLRELAVTDASAVLAWEPDRGWRSLLPAQDARSAVFDLYLPFCSAHARCPRTVGHIGQSLDGFVATAAGDSYYVTGPGNLLHLHRMRALCDAVIVGAETVIIDNPRLTTRLATGSNPLRVILDPSRRVAGNQNVFRDGAAPTLRACLAPGGAAAVSEGVSDLPVAGFEGRMDLADLLRQLRARGCVRVFVEGGGITVSAFLQAGLLDRLQIAIAPLLIGEGRPALRLPSSQSLAQCLRPAARVFRMGRDVLYDCDMATPSTRDDADTEASAATDEVLSRLI